MWKCQKTWSWEPKFYCTNRTLIEGPWFWGKTYLKINKILSSEHNNPDREFEKLRRCANQNFDYDTKEVLTTTDEIKDYLVVSDDMLENKQKDISHFFTCGRHENMDV